MTANVYCRIFLNVATEQGVGTIVCSPGSRNAPLLLAAAETEAETVVVADERVAAFTALGIALTSRRPVALVCTSGSAVLNYAPAVAEAYYRGVPLIVFSADRPGQWIDQDDSQTIRQQGVLANIVKHSYHFPSYTPGNDEAEWYANRMANDAMAVALSEKRGPVHVNIALDVPLGAVCGTPLPMQRLISVERPAPDIPKPMMRELAAECAGQKILIVAGFLPPDNALNEAVSKLASLSNVAVMAENLSNLHLHALNDATAVDVVLSHLSDDERANLSPDFVISIGGALVSRKLKEFLRGATHCQHWSVGHSATTTDCFKTLTRRIETTPATFLRQLHGILKRTQHDMPETDYALRWEGARLRARAAQAVAVAEAPWSELKAFSLLEKSIPSGANLFFSNGTPVRYGQLFRFDVHACYCNRGVSGIDGCTSTAIGASLPYGGMTVLLTGDLSMTYDIGALATRLMPPRMRIVVFSNGGGAIFRFIPSTRNLPMRERLFCADPALPVEGLAKAFGLKYFHADSEESLQKVLPDFFATSAGASVLEVQVDPRTSADTLSSYLNSANSKK